MTPLTEREIYLLEHYTRDRQQMNALYSLYKDTHDRVKSWDSQLRSEVQKRSQPLTKRDKEYVLALLEAAANEPEPEPLTELRNDEEPF